MLKYNVDVTTLLSLQHREKKLQAELHDFDITYKNPRLINNSATEVGSSHARKLRNYLKCLKQI